MRDVKIFNQSDKTVRADILVANYFKDYSRASLKRLFEAKAVKLTEPIKPGEKIKAGAFITVNTELLNNKPAVIDLPVIYEDDNVVVIDKPTGIISHARSRYWDEPSVASFIRNRVKDLSGERAGIVHRLDKATSGIMICAKNADTLKFLQRQFSNHSVIKTYKAVISGRLEPDEAIIDIPICRNPAKPNTFKPDVNGKSSITHYRTIKFFNGFSLLELIPKTGRTHQLRVHLKHLNHPIVGDDLYGGQTANRLMLHAASLEIILPGAGRKRFESNLPEDFTKL